jgi:alkanesulfonate monooxygenase SsuD/methylene tetrahydromethanopterin reductase-like flavin-dependent oxidoreductase (luciferase family)
MTERSIPLAILDLSPIVSGGTAGEALRNSIELARQAEAAGYHRYWLAEHHFTPGVASSAPTLLIAQVAAATSTIRVGSAAVQTGHQTPLAIVEQFGILDALFPGRIDLGLGRSGQRRAEAIAELDARRAARAEGNGDRSDRRPAPDLPRVVDGLLIPKPFSFAKVFGSSRLKHLYQHLQQPGADTPDYGEQVEEILALLDGTLETPDGDPIVAVPGRGADVEVWIFGSSRGQSAQVAGERGLAFTANYHVSPATVLDAVEAYRDAFQPSAHHPEPYVSVSADVVVADDEATARELASPFALWVRSIRTGAGAIPFPTPEEAARHVWTPDDVELVADRVDTQFVGTAQSVADQLETLARVTGADELVVTTVTHDFADRARSHRLLAEEWQARSPSRSVASDRTRA